MLRWRKSKKRLYRRILTRAVLAQLSVSTSACHIHLRFRVSTPLYGHLKIALQKVSQVKLIRAAHYTLKAFDYLPARDKRSKRAEWLLSKEIDLESTAE